MSSFEQIARALWRARVTWFIPIWMFITAVAAIRIVWVLGRADASNLQTKSALGFSTVRHALQSWTRKDRSAAGLLAALVPFYVAIMLAGEDFTYYDNSMFTLYTLRGLNILPPIWRGNGRFFPLGHQEFNVIRHLTGTAFGYHLFPVIELIALVCLLLALDDDLAPAARACIAAFTLILPSVVISFGGLIFTERNILLWIGVFAYCMKRFDLAASPRWAAGAVIAAQFILYYKETAFIFIFTFAVTRMILRGRESGSIFAFSSDSSNKRGYLDLWLACLSMVYLLYYFAAMIPHPNMGYADQARLNYADTLWAYLRLDPLAFLLVAFVAWRSYRIFAHRQQPWLLWDSLALGGVAYFFAYLRLSMYASYYLAPVDLIACLYVGRIFVPSYANLRRPMQLAVTLAVALLLAQQLAFSTFCVFERKNTIRAKAEMARAILAHYRRDPTGTTVLYFPFANTTLVMQFGAYLQHLGVPVDTPSAPGSRNPAVVLTSAAVATEGPCVAYEEIQCRPGGAPESGDLVVVLPDDEASSAEVAPFRENGALLASYSPRPELPSWIHPYLGILHNASPHAVTQTFPDRWLDASVTQWK
jgi:hypothetical protein